MNYANPDRHVIYPLQKWIKLNIENRKFASLCPAARQPGCPLQLKAVEEKLLAYALAAAGAAALTPHANAEIVFTKANTTLGYGNFNIDLNHDGISDFTLQELLHRLIVLVHTEASCRGRCRCVNKSDWANAVRKT